MMKLREAKLAFKRPLVFGDPNQIAARDTLRLVAELEYERENYEPPYGAREPQWRDIYSMTPQEMREDIAWLRALRLPVDEAFDEADRRCGEAPRCA